MITAASINQQMKHWSADYIGIPFVPCGRSHDGLDCWGLVTLVYDEVIGIQVNSLTGRYVTAEEREDIAAIVEGEVAHGDFVQIATESVSEFDVLLFRCLGLQSHVGVVCGSGLMLHATAGHDSSIERYADGRWLPRLTSAWRHKSKA